MTGRFQHVAPAQIEQLVARQVRNEGLLTVDLAAVSRAHPHAPLGGCRERRARLAARACRYWWWSRSPPPGGGLTVWSMRAECCLRPASAASLRDWPRLSGPDGSEAEVTQRYLAMQRRLTAAGLDITRAAAGCARRLAARPRRTASRCGSGRSQVDERFEKFMSAALGIVEHRAPDISYVDMRYTNGFAIGWRSGATHA